MSARKKPKPPDFAKPPKRLPRQNMQAPVVPEKPLANPFHEKLVQTVLSNPQFSPARCYQIAASNPALTPQDRYSAHAILRIPAVSARLAYLQTQEAERGSMDRDELRRYLETVIRTPLSELTPDHVCAEEIEYREDGTVKKVKLDKMRAAQMLAQMHGWDRPAGEAVAHIDAQRVLVAVLNGTVHLHGS
jgi:hypothetical protein